MANVTNWLLFQSAQDIEQFGSPWVSPLAALTIGGGEASSGPVGLFSPDPSTNTLRFRDTLNGSPPPEGFTLLGVEVEVRGRWTGNSNGTRSVRVEAHVGGVVRADLGSGSLPLNLTNSFLKGGPTDTMGLNEADVLDPAFGFQVVGSSTSQRLGGNTLLLDVVRWRFHWNGLATGSSLGRSRSRRAVVLGSAL